MFKMNFFLVVLSVVAAVASGSLTKGKVKAGDNVCATSELNARSKAGLDGGYVLTIHSGDCAIIHGGILTKDGYTWYQLDYAGQVVWAAGKYLSPGGSGAAACGVARKNKACQIMKYVNSGVVDLAKSHPSGVRDNAYAYNNIRDMCNGKKASVSRYSCNVCPTGTPGGYTCLTNGVLDFIIHLAQRGTVIINELAGACHSCKSRHYNGQAIDLHNDRRTSEYMRTCVNMGGWALDEHNHIHCQFYD